MAAERVSDPGPSQGSRQPTSVDVVIIGAGLAGLSAAHHLQKKHAQLKYVVLEAKGMQLGTSNLCI